jgi:DNA-binding MarR family transcriptional regulator
MSTDPRSGLGLSEDEAAQLGADGAIRIRSFRLIVLLAQELRTLMDQRLRPDGLTTQQAALISVVEAIGTPSLAQAAAAFGTSHQNLKQIADALGRKGFLRITRDKNDARIRRLSTTPKSRRHWQQRSLADQQAVLEWFATLSPRDAQTLFRLLLRLEHNVRKNLTPTAQE